MSHCAIGPRARLQVGRNRCPICKPSAGGSVRTAQNSAVLRALAVAIAGALVAQPLIVNSPDTDQIAPVREDGFGIRRASLDPRLGQVERLELTKPLSSWGSEQAIRARAAHLANAFEGAYGRVLRIERTGEALAIVSAAPPGIPLSDVLAALEFKTVTLSGDELLQLAASVVDAVAGIHASIAPRSHGALTPAHIVVQQNGVATLTGAVFAEALQSLEHNREVLWRDFGLALPPSASLPRFDQRGDVTQLGVIVLSIAIRRTLRRDEYPRGTTDVVNTVAPTDDVAKNARIRQWLQDTLQLHGRVVFSSAVDAAQVFSEIVPPISKDDATTVALQAALRQLCGATTTDLPHLRAS
jgi:hypothetical protein